MNQNKNGYPESHRKRTAAQQQQQQTSTPNLYQQPPSQLDPNLHQSFPTAGRRRVAQERYLAAVATNTNTSGGGQLPQQQQIYSTNNNTMAPGGVTYAPPPSASDPYRHQQVVQQPPPPQPSSIYGHAPPPSYTTAALSGGYPYHASSRTQQQQQHHHSQHHAAPPVQSYTDVAAAMSTGTAAAGGSSSSAVRPSMDRPLMKLSVGLIETYKRINTVYYEERDQRRRNRAAAAAEKKGNGANNNGWDDENFDYIINPGEVFYNRYKIKERIGKGSFGQVVRAEDLETHQEVAIKIIKSKKPFLMQAKTEIELLTHLWEKDPEDQHNIVRLLTHFMYRNHQCLVFEMLSLNLYELLKNTQFGGVSLNLIRKFAKQVLRALAFLARSDVDVIHCDLKPENILLRHPKRSGVKVIDFGSSCRSNKRMYSYIQSRFYRSPEVMLGLPYSVSIDIWSLGCILVEMHTGEPLFSGSDQFDQMQKIVKTLGMVPNEMLDRSSDHIRHQFFVRKKGQLDWTLRQTKEGNEKETKPQDYIVPSTDPIATLTEVVTTGAQQKKKYPPSEAHNSQRNYELFIDLVYKMLAYNPEERIKPLDALEHPFLTFAESSSSSPRHS